LTNVAFLEVLEETRNEIQHLCKIKIENLQKVHLQIHKKKKQV